MFSRNHLTLAFLMLLLVAGSVFAQEGAMDDQAGMEAWMKASTPGPFHEFFAKKAGTWNIASKMWTQPGAEPLESHSTAESRMVLGGRYLMDTMEGETMGLPFEGMGITGYDNISGVITSVWYDNMGTATGILTGTCENPGDPLELFGEMFDPMSGMNMKVRTVTTFISNDESLFVYYASYEGMPEMKVMELRYSRAD